MENLSPEHVETAKTHISPMSPSGDRARVPSQSLGQEVSGGGGRDNQAWQGCWTDTESGPKGMPWN